MVKYYCCLIPLLFLLSLSCSSPSGSDASLVSPAMAMPIVTGLYITNSTGPQPVAVWGNPSESSSFSLADTLSENYRERINGSAAVKPWSAAPVPLPLGYAFIHPYPNPAYSLCVLGFILPVDSKVDLWAVHAQWVGDLESGLGGTAGAVASTMQKTAIIFMQNKDLQAGVYEIDWGWFQSDHNSVPPGFYRVYFRVNNTTYWNDVLLYRNSSDVPPGLRDFIFY